MDSDSDVDWGSITANPSGLPDRILVKIQGLQVRADLNGLFASVLDLPIRSDNRIGVKVCASKERVWIKRENIVPAPAPAPNALRPSSGIDVLSAPPAPAAAAIPSSDHENPWDFSDSEDEPAPDRRAEKLKAFRERAGKLDPRTHYCIYCGSEGPISTKCVPCGFYRGTFCFPPKGGDTLIGRKLAFVSWPWQGDPEAPYVRAGVASADAEPAPKPKYAVDPPPVRALTRDEVLGPTLGGCAGVCPKYPTCTAARLVAYVLGKVDHVTQGVEVDYRYHLQTNEDWHKMRERIIEIHEAGEENAAEVLHEEYLVAHHTLSETAPAYLPADWDGMKRRVKARQKKDKGAEERVPLEYPDSDADEDEVAAYLEAKVAQLNANAAA